MNATMTAPHIKLTLKNIDSFCLPMVSVIMPIRNESDFIERSLGAVLAQDYPADNLEVLLADGMSTDATRTMIAKLAAKYPAIRVVIVDNPGKIVPTAMNAALAVAHGEIIVRVDGHTIIKNDYVSACVDALTRSGADNVGGRMTPSSQNEFGQAVALATSSPFGIGGARFHFSEREEWVDTVYMGAWRRDVFERIGDFDEEMVRNQDDEFNYRLLSAGGKILLSNKVESEYFNRSSPRALWRQYFQYGYWKVRVLQKHPRQMRSRQFVPPAFVAVVMLGALLAPFNKTLRRLWYPVWSLYMAANVAASVYTAYKKGWQHLPRLPFVFATLHVSYGLGFLTGLVKFADRWWK
ncbi:MAG: glycosyltransferase family 2 protein [Chloroflexota bacterium]